MRRIVATALGCLWLLTACAMRPTSPTPSAIGSALGSSGPSASASPSAPATSSWEPTGLGLASNGALLVTDCIGGFLYRIEPSGATTGVATRIAGTGVSTPAGGLSGEGVPALEADLHCPADATGDRFGNILVVDHANNRIRLIDASGIIRTIIGAGPIGTSIDDGDLAGDNGPASAATLQEPWGIVFGADGVLYFCDRDNHAVRTVDAAGIIATIAGSGNRGFSGDGALAIEADLSRPQGVALDPAGNVYISDSDNHRVRRVDAGGVITTVVGTGEAGSSGDGGAATMARLVDPNGLVFDDAGNLYIADDGASVIRRVGLDGIITTVAGTGTAGFSGDGGPGTDATLNTPTDIVFDGLGYLAIADGGNHRIRILYPDETIHTFATGLP